MEFRTVIFLLSAIAVPIVDCNSEGDDLYSWRTILSDPNNVLQSWDATLVNPCTWFHITCNNDNSVIRVELGNAGLSGPLSPSLGNLTNLQYLLVGGNNLSGPIPAEIGQLKSLISLGLQQNHFSGAIPSALGNLKSLRFLRLDGNHLTGTIPLPVIQLVNWGSLSVMNVSNNRLAGTVRRSRGKGFRITTIVQDPKAPNSLKV